VLAVCWHLDLACMGIPRPLNTLELLEHVAGCVNARMPSACVVGVTLLQYMGFRQGSCPNADCKQAPFVMRSPSTTTPATMRSLLPHICICHTPTIHTCCCHCCCYDCGRHELPLGPTSCWQPWPRPTNCPRRLPPGQLPMLLPHPAAPSAQSLSLWWHMCTRSSHPVSTMHSRTWAW
jgi:hypothetical protein